MTSDAFYVPDPCSGSIFWIYVPDLCSGCHYIFRRPGGARVARTAKMGPTLQSDEKLKFDKGIDKETIRESQGEISWTPVNRFSG